MSNLILNSKLQSSLSLKMSPPKMFLMGIFLAVLVLGVLGILTPKQRETFASKINARQSDRLSPVVVEKSQENLLEQPWGHQDINACVQSARSVASNRDRQLLALGSFSQMNNHDVIKSQLYPNNTLNGSRTQPDIAECPRNGIVLGNGNNLL
jgi:hypothetical protein